MDYTADLAVLQQRAAATSAYDERRQACLQFCKPEDGERILEVGCGSGLFLNLLAEAVGSDGTIRGLDVSMDQLAVAHENCRPYRQIALQLGDILQLPYSDEEFDAVMSIQTLEFIEDLDCAVRELLRVLKPGGRFLNFATNWGTVFWNSNNKERTAAMIAAGSQQARYPNLPAVLPGRLRSTGLVRDVLQKPFTILNQTYSEAEFSYWNARLIAAFVTKQGLVPVDVADQWIGDLQDVADQGAYHFCSTAVLTGARKIS
ncbi:MAG: methyltransferase domain-containing protein [Pseudomonadota bacterium]